jgi:O-antigen polymerase
VLLPPYPPSVAIASLLVAGVTWWACWFCGGDGLSGVLRYASHAGSNHAHYTMLRDTLAMIVDKPLRGWGTAVLSKAFNIFVLTKPCPLW